MPTTPGPYMGRITELGIALTDLADQHADWSQATFGKDSERGPQGPLKHLAKEAIEALEAWESPEGDMSLVRLEFADCLLLLLDASRRAGMSPAFLIQAAKDKLEINKKRTWPTPKPGEPVEHVKETP